MGLRDDQISEQAQMYIDHIAREMKQTIEEFTLAYVRNRAISSREPHVGFVVERTDFSSSFERWQTVAQFAEYADARLYAMKRVTINEHGAEVCRFRLREAGAPLPGSEGW